MRNRLDYYLLVLLAILVIFVVYSVQFGSFRYTHYLSGYYDIGAFTYNFYWHLHGLQYYTNPAQYLVFENHLSFLAVLLIPIFALYPQLVMLLAIQDVALTITSMVIYFVVSDLMKSRKIGFAFAIAFAINPGTIALAAFDFHLEAFTVLFYVLAFYFYIKKRPLYFALSFILLLCVLEVDPFVGASLIFGLLLYEFVYNKDLEEKKTRSMLITGGASAVVMLALYYLLALYISGTYSGGSAPAIVPLQQLYNFVAMQVNLLVFQNVGYSPFLTLTWGVAGLFVLLLGFGLSSFVAPLLSVVLLVPWWAEAFLVHNIGFLYPYYQYYTYSLGGSIASAILGLKILRKSGGRSAEKFFKSSGFENFVAGTVLAISAILSLSLLSLAYLPVVPLTQTPNLNYSSLNYAVGMIPSNAGVMTQSYISPHLFEVHNLELSLGEEHNVPGVPSSYWTMPDYIIVNRYLPSYAQIINATPFNQSNFSNDYSVYFNQSGTYIYKKI